MYLVQPHARFRWVALSWRACESRRVEACKLVSARSGEREGDVAQSHAGPMQK